jgi:hypothetical protein
MSGEARHIPRLDIGGVCGDSDCERNYQKQYDAVPPAKAYLTQTIHPSSPSDAERSLPLKPCVYSEECQVRSHDGVPPGVCEVEHDFLA